MTKRGTKCAATGKVRYRDELAAMMALNSAARGGRHERSAKDERRYYRCPDCHGWHLTSQDKRR